MPSRTPAADHGPSLSTYLWLATVPIIWGTHFVALKVVFESYSPLGMLCARYSLMIIALVAALWFTERDLRFPRQDWPYLALFSLIMVTVYQPAFALGVSWTAAGESALLISIAPLFTAITGVLLGWERSTWRLWTGVALGFLGVTVVVAGGQGLAYLPPTHIKGSFVLLAAAVLWGWYALLVKPLLARSSPLKVTTYCHLVGGLPLIALGWREASVVTPRVVADLFAQGPVAHHAAWVFFGIIYYALFSGAYAFTIWYRSVQRLGSARTILFQFCVPVVGLITAIIVRHEYPSLLQWIGAAMALAGVVCAACPVGRAPAPAEPVESEETHAANAS